MPRGGLIAGTGYARTGTDARSIRQRPANPIAANPINSMAHVEGSGIADIGVNETVSVSTDNFPEAPKAEKIG